MVIVVKELGMMKEEKLIGKALYKISLYLLEKIPMVTAVLYLADTILSYFTDKSNAIISPICGMSLLPIIFFYVTSITFGFCKWHRMFIHYIVVNEALSWYDYYVGIPLNATNLLMLNLIIAGIFLFLIIYFKFRVCVKD